MRNIVVFGAVLSALVHSGMAMASFCNLILALLK